MAHSIEKLEKFLLEETRYVSLSNSHIFKPFDCGNDDLNEFLLNDAKIYSRHLRYTTQILETDSRTVAYFSLANDLLTVLINSFRSKNKTGCQFITVDAVNTHETLRFYEKTVLNISHCTIATKILVQCINH
jgi:hypothetical protein